MKRVSVLMPCYNDGAYIEEAVASVWAQTWPEMELIVVDDGSTDAQTRQVLDQLAAQGRCTLLRQENSGPAAARNNAFRHASGDYVLPLDADDRIAPDYVEKAVACLESDERAAVCYCRGEMFGETEGPWILPDYSLGEMLVDNVVFVTALMRREAYEQVGGFDEAMRLGMEDYDFFLSLLERGWTIRQLPETLFFYRIKDGSRSRQLSENGERRKKAYQSIWKKHAAFFGEHLEELLSAARGYRNAYQSVAQQVQAHDVSQALHELDLACQTAKLEAQYLRRSIRDKSPKGMIRLFMLRYGKLHNLGEETQK